MDFPENTGLLLKALRFSADKHRHQRRKNVDASPYINPPIDLANVLASAGAVRDVDVLCAAVLHDTLEDTQTTFEELRERFGRTVASVVREVSDDRSLAQSERKRLQILSSSFTSFAASLIVAACSTCRRLRSAFGSDFSSVTS